MTHTPLDLVFNRFQHAGVFSLTEFLCSFEVLGGRLHLLLLECHHGVLQMNETKSMEGSDFRSTRSYMEAKLELLRPRLCFNLIMYVRRRCQEETTNFLILLPVTVGPCLEMGASLAILPSAATNTRQKSYGNFISSSQTHQKTDKTGPETHQRTVVPERDGK